MSKRKTVKCPDCGAQVPSKSSLLDSDDETAVKKLFPLESIRHRGRKNGYHCPYDGRWFQSQKLHDGTCDFTACIRIRVEGVP